MVNSLNEDADFFDIVNGVLQGDTLASYVFIICLNYVTMNVKNLTKTQ